MAGYNIVEENVWQRMTRYCALSCREYIRSLPEYETNDGRGVEKAMKETCKMGHASTADFAAVFGNTTQDGRKNLRLYCLRVAGQIGDYTVGTWSLEQSQKGR